jgi:hypothetical protein
VALCLLADTLVMMDILILVVTAAIHSSHIMDLEFNHSITDITMDILTIMDITMVITNMAFMVIRNNHGTDLVRRILYRTKKNMLKNMNMTNV